MHTRHAADPESRPKPLTRRLSMELCTLVIPGRIPKMPGTWGSLAAVLLAPLVYLPYAWGGRVLALAVIFLLGGLAATQVERHLAQKDPGRIIIDEVLGQWLTFLPFAHCSTWDLAVGFVLFRLFDISKPPPVRNAEYWLPEGFGVMIDDVLAGFYAMAGLWLVRLIAL